MVAMIGEGEQLRGVQLPIQSKSPTFVQPWEADAGPAELARIAAAADESRLGYVAVCDHVAVPTDLNISSTWYDTVATLAWLGARCPNLWLLSHVYVAAYRHPLAVAKSFATLDALTGGRVILGVGAGHVQREFEALGVNFDDRGSALEEAIVAVRTAFEAANPGDVDAGFSLVGKRYPATSVRVGPAPTRPGGPPIWVGGSSPAAVRRAAQLGDGWLPQGPPKGGMRAAIQRIGELREAAGRVDEPFAVGVLCEPIRLGDPIEGQPDYTLSGPAENVADRLARYASRGINQLQLSFLATSVDDYCDQLLRFGQEVAPHLPPSPALQSDPAA
ncbi:MAG: TIGR03619 family F420-dependent LLM class oxidoreductase [Candidatus Microthrix sp.]|jgi:probable F420-dependent oxidoreductase|nr:TIGR03619 family F420-dependent LLM class oxidoreductase [Candidatus Microthrix sp.]